MREHSAAFAAEVGQRIRRLRAQRGLSLSELALRAGVGKATLSGLEAGIRNPTVETLYAITAQLDVPLAAVLTDMLTESGVPPDHAVPSDPDVRPERPERPEPPEIIHGSAVSAALLETFVDGLVTTELYRLRIRPGRVQVSPAHPLGAVEFLTVFTGTARVGPLDRPIVIPAGGHASWVSDVPHMYAAETGEDVHASLVIRHTASRTGGATARGARTDPI
ncbi:helix-turn-helix domain-containing protein [Microtetraspora sp. AC03309]|uniref:XRE family transcriptional regulator n=1 Tax=Microtetraspora sp. AC03309 TaxID=2779376 RepID=UPI001E3DF7EA|nr:XRE family transcriptional regulator [Microtetraspora sp. AC03309]MCC5575189.1 helix-turn-helix domain-containing protein [Microtetraspora sp. AC03309]